METVILDQTPLADYLKGLLDISTLPGPLIGPSHLLTRAMADEGDEQPREWALAEPDAIIDTPPPSPPSPSFAPVGRPMVKSRFRNKIPNSLRLDIPHKKRLSSLQNLQDGAKAVATKLDRADNSKFLEQFRYTIVASQLLSGDSVLGQHRLLAQSNGNTSVADHEPSIPTEAGLLLTAAGALILAWVISWLCGGGYSHLTKKRVVFFVGLVVVVAVLSHTYVRQQWLRYVREQAVAEMSSFVTKSQDFDSAASAAVALIQEVELVSRGYRISVPLPPISRIDDRNQGRRCVRLRKALKTSFKDMLLKYEQTFDVVKGFSEQLDLEKYHDIYDISDLDISDALQGFKESEFEDTESLRTLKIVAARFHTMRKMFLCALLALEAHGDNSDFLRWTTAVEGLRVLNEATSESYERLRTILSEEESFPATSSLKTPLSPGRERWRSQLRKLNSLTTGIRGLQAKMSLLREESDRALNEADDVSELGPSLMAQYESIGQDIKMLQGAWEEGKAALASGINRNEKRLSSLSAMLSPASTLSGITTVEEGGVVDALKILNGESPSHKYSTGTPSEPDTEEVFEAVAMPRPRNLFSREERIAKMKEDRERKAEMKEKAEASRGMLRELEMVINLRPTKGRPTTMPPPSRISL
ncbi:putative proliferating cell nuclear antigen protein [Phaeoacremonium minimum UCRPA7]|uniref:Vezatin n=1 Tax=Phaeoacremonium minimum (strain UCR-PA7) TaxID=1286976 RepID=R8BC97_PHAM7|nr:putative proliferating cell nuclear antigen protein [Phaeoacremonium minimum UCRPA7]EON96922.1 putative proliferating cell nuclear antigen protein [Phaeoacremonium minimum UCRPA7]